jgi:hypothetical protein
VTEKLGTCGRKSYGFGGVRRSAMAVVSSGAGDRFPLWTLGTASVARSSMRK